MNRALLVAALAAGAIHCGGDDGRNPALPGADGGPMVDSGMSTTPDGNAASPDGAVDADGPQIAIISPTEPASGDLSSGAIVTEAQLTVVCSAAPNATSNSPVDSTSVTISVISAAATVDAQAAPNGNIHEYQAVVDVSALGNGPITVRCTASDLTFGAPASNSGEISTFLDLGPRIDVFNPVAGQHYRAQVELSFTVTESPVSASDTGAAVADVRAFVGNVELTGLTPSAMGSTTAWTGLLEFDDPAFTPPLDGDIALTIEATNSRSGGGVTRREQVAFVGDDDGPIISIITPEPAELLSGFVVIEASVSDPAGVAQVVATMNQEFEISLSPAGGDRFSGVFDTRLLGTDVVFPLLEVRAIDAVGNDDRSTGRITALDNRAPFLSLDSPPVREANCVGNVVECLLQTPYECTRLFDPLGTDAADDGETVPQITELRVRALDFTNGALNTGVRFPGATIDSSSVELFILDDHTVPILVDTDDDGVCDDINPAVIPDSGVELVTEAAIVSLAEVPVSGSSHLASYATATGSLPEVGDAACLEPLEDASAPAPLCGPTELTRVIDSSSFPGESQLYGVPPLDLVCTGGGVDFVGAAIEDGWACVAARGRDELGNRGVSAPIRICVDSDGDGTDASDGTGTDLTTLGCGSGLGSIAAEIDRPDCNTGCDLPESFRDRPGLQVVPLGVTTRQCADDNDNDGDGNVDYPDDLDCTAANDNTEG